jgi:group I intron endonuclease
MAQMIIYKITNKVNNKVYIGQTIHTIEKRWSRHCSKNSGCLALVNAIKKHKKDSFTIEQIDSASSVEELNKKENEWILKCNSLYPNGYNLNTGGDSKVWSDESKLKISKSHKNKILSKTHRHNISKGVLKAIDEDPEKFKKGTVKMCENMSKMIKSGNHPKKNKKVSKEGRQNMSESKKGSKNPMFGKRLTENQLNGLEVAYKNRINNLPSVYCHQNGKVYKTVTAAAKELDLARSSVSNVLTGFRKNIKGYTFEYFKTGNSNET